MDNEQYEERIRIEKAIMNQEIPSFELMGSGVSRYFIGWHTTGKSNRYQLKIQLSANYPDRVPALLVVSPKILKMQGGGALNTQASSHSFHTLSNGPDGSVRVCHIGTQRWNASYTCVAVALQGMLWLEAYDEYLSTGIPVDSILQEWEREKGNG